MSWLSDLALIRDFQLGEVTVTPAAQEALMRNAQAKESLLDTHRVHDSEGGALLRNLHAKSHGHYFSSATLPDGTVLKIDTLTARAVHSGGKPKTAISVLGENPFGSNHPIILDKD